MPCPELPGAWIPARVNSHTELQGRWCQAGSAARAQLPARRKLHLSKHGNAGARVTPVSVGWMKDVTAARVVQIAPLCPLAFSPLLPPGLAVTAVLSPLHHSVLGLLISFSSIRMLLRQSEYSSQQKLDCVKMPKIYPEVYHFTYRIRKVSFY